MTRLSEWCGRFFGWLAIALLGVTAFTAPDGAGRADYGTDCAVDKCSGYTGTYFDSCMNSCCSGDCIAQYGYGTDDYKSCMATCTSVALSSCPSVCTRDCNLNKSGTGCDGTCTGTQCINLGCGCGPSAAAMIMCGCWDQDGNGI